MARLDTQPTLGIIYLRHKRLELQRDHRTCLRLTAVGTSLALTLPSPRATDPAVSAQWAHFTAGHYSAQSLHLIYFSASLLSCINTSIILISGPGTHIGDLLPRKPSSHSLASVLDSSSRVFCLLIQWTPEHFTFCCCWKHILPLVSFLCFTSVVQRHDWLRLCASLNGFIN